MYFGVDHGVWVLGGDAQWFPWASTREKIEHSVNFFNEIRKLIYMVFYCSYEDKAFYEHIAKHGIIRRVGTLYGFSRSPMWEVKWEV